jgi:hypothetical protein
MMSEYQGPAWNGRFEEYVVNDETGEAYTVLYLADRNNDAMQAAGKPPQYYWVPGGIRIARNPATGDYKFRLGHFVGLGADGSNQVEGGTLAFTVTTSYPDAVLQQANDQLLAKFQGKDEKYWGWQTKAAPQFAIAPIASAATAISSIAPAPDGTAGHAGLDEWAWLMHGEGAGSTTGGENAFSALLGAYPSEILWAGFHGVYSPIVVSQNLVIPVWSEVLDLTITGKWDEIYNGFSSDLSVQAWWATADVKAAFEKLQRDGTVKVELIIDSTVPKGDELQKKIDERIDLIFKQFMDLAMKTIFNPAPPSIGEAEAPKSKDLFSKLWPKYGAFVGLKAKHEVKNLTLDYHESRTFRFNQPNTISSSLEGLFHECAADPKAEGKYFEKQELGKLAKKVVRIAQPVLTPAPTGTGCPPDPVVAVSASVGYPAPDGSIDWGNAQQGNGPQQWQPTDHDSRKFVWLRRDASEVQNPPEGWTPDVAYVARKLILREARVYTTDLGFVSIETDTLDLDPAGGTATRDPVFEVSDAGAGKFEIEVTALDAMLENANQFVSVEFQFVDESGTGSERPIASLVWKSSNQDASRLISFCTGRRDVPPKWQYRTTFVQKRVLTDPTSKGLKWTGPWIEQAASGQVTLHVSAPGEQDVMMQFLPENEESAQDETPDLSPVRQAD